MKNIKILLLLCIIIMIFFQFGCNQKNDDLNNNQEENEIQYYSDGLTYSLSDDKNSYIVTGFTSDANYICIPDTYQGLPVTDLGTGAFQNSIMKEIIIGKNVKDMGWYVFDNCQNLSKFIVQEENEYYSTEDDILFNYDKSSLVCYPQNKSGSKYIIPEYVSDLCYFAFESSNYLQEVTISKNIKVIEGSCFAGCEKLETVLLPDGLLEITRNAFNGCNNLKNISIPNTVTTISSYAFYNCSSLETISIPISVYSIGEKAFYECPSLTIKCEQTKKPSSWSKEWVSRRTTVLWNQ